MPRLASLPALALALSFAPAVARAEVGAAAFAPSHEQLLVGLEDFTFDTDWFPKNAPLQLKLIVHGGNSVQIDMPGEGRYDWDAEQITFAGEAGAGRLGVDVGFTLDAKVRFDVLGLKWESDIIGPYDYAVIAEGDFTPYLLPGNPDRPVIIDDETDPVTLVSVPVTPDILVAAGNLDIDIYVIVEASLEGQSITASTIEPEPQLVTITSEGESVTLLAGAGPTPDPLLVDGTLTCALHTAPTVVLKPTLVMEILGQKFEVADIEVPVALPPFDDAVRFPTVAMSFPRPAFEEVTTGDDSHGDSHGYSSSDSDTPTGGEDGSGGDSDSGSEADSGGDEAGGAIPPEADGCNCDARGRGGAWLLGFALLGLRRRRR